MEFKIKLRDNTKETFYISLGAIFMYRWDGSEWVKVGEIKIFK